MVNHLNKNILIKKMYKIAIGLIDDKGKNIVMVQLSFMLVASFFILFKNPFPKFWRWLCTFYLN